MDRPSDRLVLQLAWLMEATREQVFRRLVDPAELARWWGPAGFTTPQVEWKPRVGAAYQLDMQPPDGERFHLSGEFLEVRPPSRLVFTFRWEEPDPDDVETVAALSLAAIGDATRLSLVQGDFATEARLNLHRGGWSDSVVKLQQLLESDR